MRSVIVLRDGGKIVVEARHTLKTIVISHGDAVISLPAEMAGVFSMAVECAAFAIYKGPSFEIVPDRGVRCHGDACCAGQLECPTPMACGVR